MKYKTITSLFFLSVSISCLQAMEKENSDKDIKDVYFTPLKQHFVLQQMETPGEKVINKQKNLLTEKHILDVFGQEVLTKIKDKTDLSIFLRNDLEFDDSEKRNSLRFIKNIIKQYKDINEKSYRMYFDILELEDEIKDVNLHRIKENTIAYFSKTSSISFLSKENGDQLGVIAELSPSFGNKIKYYIKTHSAGLQSQHSSGAKILDPKELAVYKILEQFQIGCETHFFGRDLKNFYIATKDAKADGDFHTYDNLKKSSDLYSIYSNFKGDIEYGLTALDLLSRILRLSDLQTNPGNFGFIPTPELDGYQVKVIDFRVRDDESYKVTEDHFRGFLEGNGQFNYSSDDLMNEVLKKQDKEIRIERAKKVFETVLANYNKVLENTFSVVLMNIEKVSENTINKKYLEHLNESLKTYLCDIKLNFELFEKNLNK